MKHRRFVLAALLWSAAGVTACGDDTVAVLPQDAGTDHSVTTDGTAPDAPFEVGTYVDSAAPDSGDAAAPIPPRLLLSYNGQTQSEVVAFGLQSKAVDGRLTFDDYLGGAYVGTTAPWVLEESTDVVGRLDAQEPWVIDSSWNVAMNDLTDAGYAQPYSDPTAVVVGAGTKAYVLRYNRNLVAILDTSQNVDGGAPAGSIDLSGEVQTGGDGYVQPIAGVYVAAQQRVYVLLGNIDRFDVVDDGYDLLCTTSTPTIIAIDTTSDSLVDLNGTAPGHGWPLVGYSPVFGSGAMVYDPLTSADGGSYGRLLVLDAGCYTVTPDGGAGALTEREIESIDLGTGQATELLDLTSAPFPTSLTYVDAHHAVVQLDTAYAWDPTTTTLGPAIPNAPEAFAYDGQGHLLGVSGVYGPDGGMTGYSVVSVAVADGGVTQLGSDPFQLTNGFVGGAALWPAP
jgi:hypothetical protein